jgi:hypothetical protein
MGRRREQRTRRQAPRSATARRCPSQPMISVNGYPSKRPASTVGYDCLSAPGGVGVADVAFASPSQTATPADGQHRIPRKTTLSRVPSTATAPTDHPGPSHPLRRQPFAVPGPRKQPVGIPCLGSTRQRRSSTRYQVDYSKLALADDVDSSRDGSLSPSPSTGEHSIISETDSDQAEDERIERSMGVIRKKTAARGTEGGTKYHCDVCSVDITSTVCHLPYVSGSVY